MKYLITGIVIVLLSFGCSQSKKKTDRKDGNKRDLNAVQWTEKQLLDTIQDQTFTYFWNRAEPT